MGEREGRQTKRTAGSKGQKLPVGSGSSTLASRRKRSRQGPLARVAYWTLVLSVWALIMGVGSLAFVAATLPPIQSLEVPKRPPTVEIVGIDGRPLVTRGEMSGTDVPIKQPPASLPKAFVAIEDRRFYSHFGVDPVGLARAALANVLRRHVAQGG